MICFLEAPDKLEHGLPLLTDGIQTTVEYIAIGNLGKNTIKYA